MSLAAIERWLIGDARLVASPVALMDGFGQRLVEAGLAPGRLNVQLRTLHPVVAAQLLVWRPREVALDAVSSLANIVARANDDVAGGVVQQVSLAHGAFEAAPYLVSPLARVYGGEPYVRRALPPGTTTFEFPILEDLYNAGATDYLALPLLFSAGRRGAVTLATVRPGGFTDAEVDELVGLGPAIAACFDVFLANHVARTLLDTYVGRRTGERVLAGRIRSGDVERLDAAIWFSDLRGFTVISSEIPATELVAWLNVYFDAVCGAIGRHGGEVLKFIGDAVLAVFPVDGDPASACRAARAAARDAHDALDALNATRASAGLPALQHGIALHLGEVQYGNIGANARLDFTVIGRAVNLTSRLEGLCGRLGRRTIASATFASHADGFVPLGAYALKGIADPVEVCGEAP